MIKNYARTLLFNFLSPRIIRTLARIRRRASLAVTAILQNSTTKLAVKGRILSGQFTSNDVDYAQKYNMGEIVNWAKALLQYNNDTNSTLIHCAWVTLPYQGNVGDWLAPYILKKTTKKPIKHVNLRDHSSVDHFFTVGSILASATASSTIIGAGFNSKSDAVVKDAKYIFVRGHLSQEKLNAHGIETLLPPCDPGFFLPSIYQPTHVEQKASLAFVPHVNHVAEWNAFQPSVATMVPYARTTAEIEHLIDQLHQFDKIATSAMHIFILCYAYGIPVSLIRPINTISIVPGDGFKYLDMSSILPVSNISPFPLELTGTSNNFDRVKFYTGKQSQYFKSCYEGFSRYLENKSI